MVRQVLSRRGPCPSLYCARNHGKAGFVTATMSDSPSSRDSSPRDRRQGGLRVLGGSLGTVTKRAFARRGLAGADIARHWPAIVGSELAAHCRPRQLRFAKAGDPVDGRLTLRVAPGWAIQLKHLEPLVLERINSFLDRKSTRLNSSH